MFNYLYFYWVSVNKFTKDSRQINLKPTDGNPYTQKQRQCFIYQPPTNKSLIIINSIFVDYLYAIEHSQRGP